MNFPSYGLRGEIKHMCYAQYGLAKEKNKISIKKTNYTLFPPTTREFIFLIGLLLNA